jgi:hypothetical protein
MGFTVNPGMIMIMYYLVQAESEIAALTDEETVNIERRPKHTRKNPTL